MNLTSLRRVKLALGITDSSQDGVLGRLIPAASLQAHNYCRRRDGIEYKSRTEYHSPYDGQRAFALEAFPVASVTTVKTDATGRYTGSEATLDSTAYNVGEDGKTLILLDDPSVLHHTSPFTFAGPKGLQVVYVAGLAADPVVSVWTKSASAFTVGKYIVGSLSGAVGYVTATASGTISYECLAGIFLAAETITEYTTYSFALSGGGPSSATGVTATLTANTSLSLAEGYPDLVEGTEMLVNFLRRNRNALEATQVQLDSEQRSGSADRSRDYFALPEIRAMFDPYVDRRYGYRGQR